jgi:hypothetical protein
MLPRPIIAATQWKAPRGEACELSLRLRIGVFIFDGDIDMAAAYADYLRSH